MDIFRRILFLRHPVEEGGQSVPWFSDLHIRLPIIFSLVVISILWIAVLIKTRGQSDPIPLHFNAFYGVEFVGSGFLFFQIPFIGTILAAINSWLSRRIFLYDLFLSRFIAWATFAVAVLLGIAVIAILLLNR